MPDRRGKCEHRLVSAAIDLSPSLSDDLPELRRGYRLAPMRSEDVPEVGQVERRCFTNPWPVSAYRRELLHPEQNHYIVLRNVPPGQDAMVTEQDHPPARTVARRTLLPLGFGRRHEPNGRSGNSAVVGFAGMWTAFDEAHVTTIAIDEPYRGMGLGEVLLAALFDEADRRGAVWITLEVRVSNDAAQALYRKWGFAVQGTRLRYYSDNNEDAHIMWSRALTDADYRAELTRLRTGLAERLDGPVAGFSPRIATRPGGPPPAPPWETGTGA